MDGTQVVDRPWILRHHLFCPQEREYYKCLGKKFIVVILGMKRLFGV